MHLARRFSLLTLLPLLCLGQESSHQARFQKLDRDGDGVVSAAELNNPALLARLDRNHDGLISKDELPGAPAAPTAPAALVPTQADVAYGPDSHQRLDLYLPMTAEAPAPVAVYIHGGGFVGGDKRKGMNELFPALLDRGVAVVAINYRFRDQAPIQDILRDCARAVQFVRYRASEWNLDPRRVVPFGGSAGAGTSLWLATHPDLADPANADPVLRESSRVLGAGCINGQCTYDVFRWPELLDAPLELILEQTRDVPFYDFPIDAPETARAKAVRADVDMLGLLTADDPPPFLFCANLDRPPHDANGVNHHPRHATAVADACRQLGLPATLLLAEKGRRPDFRPPLLAYLFERLGVVAKP